MSLDKAIAHGKEHRKPYRGEKKEELICLYHTDVKIAYTASIFQKIVVGIAQSAYLMMKSAKRIIVMMIGHKCKSHRTHLPESW